MVTIIEFRPQPDAPAVAVLPAAPPPKRPNPPAVRKPSPPLAPRPSEYPAASAAAAEPTVPALAAASVQPPAPPIPTSSGRVAPIPTEYLWDVSTTLSLRRIYPLSARDAHQQGTAVVHVHLRRDGTVLDVTLTKSSGYAALDKEAREEVLRIGKFGELPARYCPGEADFAIDQPVDFRLH